MRGKILVKGLGAGKTKIKVRYLMVATLMAGAVSLPRYAVQAESCPDVRVVFARGSGGERWEDQNYLAYKSSIEEKLKTVNIGYEFIDLDYPAVGVDDVKVLVGAAVGAGEAYEFGESVQTGAENLIAMVNSDGCPTTRYVVGGYSQGAMVISKALGSLNSDKMIYAATFGDPKLYLPEGAGLFPAACRGDNLSDYRMHVPDCQAYKGLLGAQIPYEPVELVGKVGTWCNKRDIFCSSHLNISDHLAYVSENLYEDASRVIFDKICRAFGVENKISSPHDTAVLIDSTGSMSSMIETYKAEALRLAKETLESGGRVALYDYRDLADPYTPVKHCDFNTCTLEVFESELSTIGADGGGDESESLLSGSLHVMQDLEWKKGSTKSLVVLTDAGFLSPDRDGVTFDEVVALSKSIDPVNFYIITNEYAGEEYQELATATDGRVVTNFDELSLLTDYIMERYDSLPRVEESVAPENVTKPTVAVKNIASIKGGDSESGAKVEFSTTGTEVLVVLNEALLGIAEVTDGTGTIMITGLDSALENKLTLIPARDDMKGDEVETTLNVGDLGYGETSGENDAIITGTSVTNHSNSSEQLVLPSSYMIKAPNTGRGLNGR